EFTVASWERLARFVDNARIALDNNATERSLSGPVVGRKTHSGSKSLTGTQAAETLYSLLETTKPCGVEPAAYLAAAVRAADLGEVLLPAQSAAAEPPP